MNVLIVNPNYYRSSGVTIAIKRLGRALALTGDVSVHFADCSYGNSRERDMSSWDLPWNGTFRLMSKSPLTLFRESLRLLRYLRNNKIEIIHVHHRRLALITGFVAKFLRIPVVYTGHLTYARNRVFLLAPIAAGIAISDSVLENMRKTVGNRTVHLVSNVVEFPPVCPPQPDNSPLLVSCIARLDPVKNHETLLRAWAMAAPDPEKIRLQLVGEGKDRSRLEALAEELGITSGVDFLGYRNDVDRILDKSFFCILPSFVEGQPLVMLEAAAAGKPTLATDVDGSRDCVPPGALLKNLVDPNSVQEMAEAISLWINNLDRVTEEGRVFYSYWKGLSSPEVVGRLTRDIYEKVLRRPWGQT